MDKKPHETQPVRTEIDAVPNNYVDENLLEMQRIEGQGPLKKVNMKDLPKPLRLFGYFVITCIMLMVIFGIIVSIFK